MANSSRGLVSQRVQQLAPSGIRRFFDLIHSMDNVISLGVGEPDFMTPWHIREAAIHAIEQGQTHYTSNHGLLELRERVAQDITARYGVSYDPQREILITVGVSEGVDLALRSILDPGDEVLLPEPCYVSYAPCVTLAGGTPIPVTTTEETGFRIQPEVLERHITARTRAIMLNYPNNPTGAVLSRAELARIAAVVRRHNLLVISDEIYDRLVYDGHTHTCFSSLPGMRERTVLLAGFSKSYAMTGWRVGYAAAPAPLLDSMVKIHQYTMLSSPTLGQQAALAALEGDQSVVDEMLIAYNQRRRLLVKGLNAIGLPCFEPKGAFYAFPSIKSTGLSAEEFAERLLLQERVAVVPGTAFGASGAGYVRCCYAVSLPELEEALLRIRRFVQQQARRQ